MENYKDTMKSLRKQVSVLQRQIKNAQIPVLIIFDGYVAARTGDFLNELIFEMDPHYFEVNVFEKKTETDKRMPMLWRFCNKLPQKGTISIFVRSYYGELFNGYKHDDAYEKQVLNIVAQKEKMLVDDGMLILKFFLDLDKESQKKRMNKLLKNPETRFRVTKDDLEQNKKYEKCKKNFDKIMLRTNYEFAPWRRLNVCDIDMAKYDLLTQVKLALEDSLDQVKKQISQPSEKYVKTKNHLARMDLSEYQLTDVEYKRKLKDLQKEAKKLAYALYTERIPTVLVFEGWDAAGKGGSIKRLLKRVDPRGYNVVPISAPTGYEKEMHYLYRFYKNLPKTGHMTIYDRSWYGRVLVERVEQFATELEWKRAYTEINDFEKELTHWGAMVIKFFIHIDEKTQLERFQAREANPLKQYKITDEDWRNRDQWEAYEDAISEMIEKTDTREAPWVLIPGNDKKYARLKVLETFINSAKKTAERPPYPITH